MRFVAQHEILSTLEQSFFLLNRQTQAIFWPGKLSFPFFVGLVQKLTKPYFCVIMNCIIWFVKIILFKIYKIKNINWIAICRKVQHYYLLFAHVRVSLGPNPPYVRMRWSMKQTDLKNYMHVVCLKAFRLDVRRQFQNVWNINSAKIGVKMTQSFSSKTVEANCIIFLPPHSSFPFVYARWREGISWSFLSHALFPRPARASLAW